MRARQRFTVLYGTLFLLSGAALLAIAGIVSSTAVRVSSPAPGQRPAGAGSDLARAQAEIGRLHARLAELQAEQTRQFLVGAAVALCVMTVASVLLGRFVAGRVLRPLRTITAATRRISADNLHERLAVSGPADEVKDLADTIDGLLGRLEEAFCAQRRFVANASHELRTPLTTMRASLDVAVAKPGPVPPPLAGLADRLRGELDDVDRLLEGLLVLARAQHADRAGPADRTALSLSDLVSAALAERADGIATRRLAVRTTGDDAETAGNPALLRRLVDNLIDNAVRHNHDDGWIHVGIARVGATARLVVETGGDVLDADQVGSLAEPFHRLGPERTRSRDGAGLGLSIVAAIATAHGGVLELAARREGGLRATVSLPATMAAMTAGPKAEVSG